VTAAAAPKKVMERRVRGDKRGKKAVTEGGKKALTALVWGQKNGFYFKHSLKSREVKEDVEAKERGMERGRKEGRKGGGVKEGKKQGEVDGGCIKGGGEERGVKGRGRTKGRRGRCKRGRVEGGERNMMVWCLFSDGGSGTKGR